MEGSALQPAIQTKLQHDRLRAVLGVLVQDPPLITEIRTQPQRTADQAVLIVIGPIVLHWNIVRGGFRGSAPSGAVVGRCRHVGNLSGGEERRLYEYAATRGPSHVAIHRSHECNAGLTPWRRQRARAVSLGHLAT
jgi:hypothetical protein